MKKLVVVLALSITFLLGGCSGNGDVDVGKWGVLKLPNGDVIEGKIESLTRWSNSQYEVTIDGITYNVHPKDFACYGGKDE